MSLAVTKLLPKSGLKGSTTFTVSPTRDPQKTKEAAIPLGKGRSVACFELTYFDVPYTLSFTPVRLPATPLATVSVTLNVHLPAADSPQKCGVVNT